MSSPAWIFVEREHGIPLVVGPYPSEQSAEHALTDALLIDGFAEEDALDIFVVTEAERPVTGVEHVIIDPTNPDHTG